jgi:uncharacterized RDD family membrane protein YckC
MKPGVPASQPAIDLTANVTTPENIEFAYRLAGPFRRLNAFLIDLMLRASILLFLFLFAICSGIAGAWPLSDSTPQILMTMLYFLFDWFYGLAFETLWNGKTPGKKMCQLRAISVNGRPISAYQATIRNFLRLGDLAPFVSFGMLIKDASPATVIPTGAVALACMFLTRRFQRLGDLAAGTMVVVDDLTWIPPKIKVADSAAMKILSTISPSFRMSRSLQRTVASFVERRPYLSKERRAELAKLIAPALFERAGVPSTTNPDDFLCALYLREFEMQPSR